MSNLLIRISLEEAVLRRNSLPEISKCFCGCFSQELEDECGIFVCDSCGLDTPWCRGASDKYWEDCDSCATLKFEIEEGK